MKTVVTYDKVNLTDQQKSNIETRGLKVLHIDELEALVCFFSSSFLSLVSLMLFTWHF